LIAVDVQEAGTSTSLSLSLKLLKDNDLKAAAALSTQKTGFLIISSAIDLSHVIILPVAGISDPKETWNSIDDAKN